KLAEQGVLAWSSGALPQSIEYDETGRHIKRWAVIEGSLTPTPAMPQYTIVSTTKAHPIELDAKEDTPQNNATSSNTDEPTNEVPSQLDKEPVMATMKRSEVKAAIKNTAQERIQMIISNLMTMLEEMEGAAPAGMDSTAMVEEMTEDATMRMEKEVFTEGDEDKAEYDEKEMKARIVKALANYDSAEATKSYVQAAKAAHDKAQAEARAVAEAAIKALPLSQPTSPKPGNGGQSPSISVSEPVRFTNAKLDDFLYAVKMRQSLLPLGATPEMKQLKTHFSPEFIRTLKGRALEHAERTKLTSDNPHTRQDYNALKGDYSFVKADELNATDITNQGLEWVSVYYDTRLWERARAQTRLMSLMEEKGMRVEDIPQGSNSINIKLNTGSATVYTRTEANSTDATGRPEVTV
ncbi:MAG TPA: hypothetical protein VKP88_04715, partial [Candidatus Paceibacterota bacterium]|nr:hypothetical protein [Candidatus Paceibacterota bacterium]